MSDAAVRLVDLRETPLDVAEVLATVSDPAAGGVALFVGAVREQDHDRPVTGLEYSAHPTAPATMRAVADRVAGEFPVTAVAAVHRVGWLRIGEAAVVVAVSAPHRGEALEACRALIDDLKANVPIWKHQRFADGTEEWVGTP